MIQPTIDKLSAYTSYYIKRVIGLSVTVEDSPQPCSINTADPVIELPMTPDTLGQFLGHDFVEHAPVELLFSIVIGLTYHEAAHLLSGEPHVQPHLLDNIINDSNDFTFVPRQWKGSMPFTISLMNTTYRQGMDLKDIPLQTRSDKLQALIHLAVSYMRKLRIRDHGKDSRSLPNNHLLGPYFERIKPIMREARKADITLRPELVGKLYDVLKDFWVNDTSPAQQSFDEALENSQPEITIVLTGEDAQELKKTLESLGTMQKVTGELTRTVISVSIQESTEEHKKDQEALKRIHELGDLGSKITSEDTHDNADPIDVNQDIVHKLRRVLRPLLFERSLTRRKPSSLGTHFSPSHFHEIRTRPNEPRIRKAVHRIGRASVETELILCFDRSGSMGGDTETVCKEVAASFYQAVEGIPQADMSLFGFDTEVTLIKESGKKRGKNVLSKISSGLSARGGTNFPLALYFALKAAEMSRAHKKIVIMLTDGDISGQILIDDLLRYARVIKTEVITLGLLRCDITNIKEQLAGTQVIYIDDIHTLPEEMGKLVLRTV